VILQRGGVVRKISFIFLFVLILNQGLFAGEESDQLCIGCEAPTFSLPSLQEGYISLRDFCGKQLRKPWLNKTKYVVIISFFATWCEPCKKEIPHLEKLQAEFSDQAVKFFLIDVGDEREKVSEYVQAKKVEIPILLDRYKKTAEKFDALTLPRLYVLDKNGLIQRKQKGFSNADDFIIEMRELIKLLLQQQ
jgi:thiol-disulfide isomerase/thioredoxin